MSRKKAFLADVQKFSPCTAIWIKWAGQLLHIWIKPPPYVWNEMVNGAKMKWCDTLWNTQNYRPMVTKLHRRRGRCSDSMALSRNATCMCCQATSNVNRGFFNHWRRDNDLIYDSITLFSIFSPWCKHSCWGTSGTSPGTRSSTWDTWKNRIRNFLFLTALKRLLQYNITKWDVMS